MASSDPHIDLSQLPASNLLTLHAQITEELRRREILRSSNNPVGDLAEFLFVNAFGWSQAPNSQKAIDAFDAKDRTFQIKGRRPTRHNKSRQLSFIRELDKKHFDCLAGVIFREDYSVFRAALIPYDVVIAHSRYSSHANGWLFQLKDDIWDIPSVEDVTLRLLEVSY
ncbi:hypothetical protein ACFO5Q_13530 [Kordiimonas lipolytica]|uniref:Restriction endonuclease n=1 Tax=Kordiimonas lipolytica TaxID=1662421 RepID=A0ABV8UDA9_9PROT|nr:hypothetical protein [Kordiimonas lipolytica]